MTGKPNAPAALRNRMAILEVIRTEFEDCKSILEIGSGTGQHAVYFARHLPWLVWQTSDLEENHEGIRAWIDDARLANVRAPLALDVSNAEWSMTSKYDAVFSANTSHIMHVPAVECMFTLVAGVMANGGRFCLYGPFNLDGDFTSDSNREFDLSLRNRDPGMGLRDLGDLDRLGLQNGLVRNRLYAMPANNMLAVWVKQDDAEGSGVDDNS